MMGEAASAPAAKAPLTRALVNRRMLQLHRWLGLVLGAQVLLWLGSGFFMSLFPIEAVRGEHLRKPASEQVLSWQPGLVGADVALAAAGGPVHDARIGQMAGAPVWRLRGPEGPMLVDARTGRRLDPIGKDQARAVALAVWTGRGQPLEPVFHAEAPRESGVDGPAWRIDFGAPDRASLYVDARSGELRSVRTTLWRVYDVFWGLHIMDWSTRENFNSWWLKATSALAVLFALSGAVLLVLRALTGRFAR